MRFENGPRAMETGVSTLAPIYHILGKNVSRPIHIMVWKYVQAGQLLTHVLVGVPVPVPGSDVGESESPKVRKSADASVAIIHRNVVSRKAMQG